MINYATRLSKRKITQCKSSHKNVDKTVYHKNVDKIGVESCDYSILWHKFSLIFLSLYHSCGYSLVNILVRYIKLNNHAIGPSCELATFLWHNSLLIILSFYHSCGNSLVRYFTLNDLAIGQS